MAAAILLGLVGSVHSILSVFCLRLKSVVELEYKLLYNVSDLSDIHLDVIGQFLLLMKRREGEISTY